MNQQKIEMIDAEVTREADAALVVSERLPAKPFTKETVEDIQQQLQLLGQVRRAVVALTTVAQWKDFGGNPYMEGDAAFTIASGLGLSFHEPKYDFVDFGPNAWQCVCTQTVGRNGREYTDHGDCDSYDEFFAKRRKELEKNGASPDVIAKILRADAQKKARANAVSRVVSGWSGLRGLSWEDLEQLGLQQSKSGRVPFRQGAAGGKLQNATCAALMQMPVGSKVALRCRIVSGIQKATSKGTPYCNIAVRDDSGSAKVRLWTAKPEWAGADADAFLPEIEVKDFRGQKQFEARKIEPIDEDVEASGGPQTPQTQEPRANGKPPQSEFPPDAGRPNDPEAY